DVEPAPAPPPATAAPPAQAPSPVLRQPQGSSARGTAALAEAALLYRQSVPQIKGLFSEARLGRAVGTENFAPLVDNITDSVLRNPGALISVTRLKQRDDYTYMHSMAVCALMV